MLECFSELPESTELEKVQLLDWPYYFSNANLIVYYNPKDPKSEIHFYKNGDVAYYYDNLRHREDGPALIRKGYQCWYQHGTIHRVDGPAIEMEGQLEWYHNGVLHREDGPAVVRDDGSGEWWKNGRYFAIYKNAVEVHHSLFL